MNVPFEYIEATYQEMKEGDFTKAAKAIEQGFNIDGIYFQHYGTFLYRAIEEEEYEIVKFLLKQGANPNVYFEGKNAFAFATWWLSKKAYKIFKLLIKYNIFFLPIFKGNKTIDYPLDYTEATTEEILQNLEYEYEMLKEYNSNPNNTNSPMMQWYEEKIMLNTEILEFVRKELEIVRPLVERHVVTLRIEVSGRNQSFDLLMDTRASGKLLESILRDILYQGNPYASFDLIIPSFHIKEKQKLELDRALSDYGVRTGTKIILVPSLQSQKHGGKTRKQKISKRGKTRHMK